MTLLYLSAVRLTGPIAHRTRRQRIKSLTLAGRVSTRKSAPQVRSRDCTPVNKGGRV